MSTAARIVGPEELASLFRSHVGARVGALLLDYDGTLADIVPTPDLARASPKLREDLASLARAPRLRVAIITGRSHEGLLGVCDRVDGLALATNGGLRIEDEAGEWVHPDAARAVPLLAGIAAKLSAEARTHPGALLEDKTLSLALHYRLAPAAREALGEAVSHALEGHEDALRVIHGKAVYEIQPRIAWDKGAAASALLDRWGIADAAMFLGDDTIDEPAFDALASRGGLGVRIGAVTESTRASYVLPDAAAARALVAALRAAFAD